MKQFFSFMIALVFVCTLTACETVESNPGSTQNTNRENTESTNSGIDPTKESIVVSGLEELNEMREMLSDKSDSAFEAYRETLIGTYTDREDLVAFVQLVDLLPYMELTEMELTEADLTKIEYSVDTETDIETARILIKDKNGNMVCFDYWLSVKNSKDQLDKMDSGDNTLMRFDSEESVQSKDGKLKILAESKRPHAAGEGTVTEWYAEANEIFIKISYFDKGNQDVKISELILNKEVTEFSKIAAMEQGR